MLGSPFVTDARHFRRHDQPPARTRRTPDQRSRHGAHQGARRAQHNLKGIDLDIPRNRMVCTGRRGSGKSRWRSTRSTPRASGGTSRASRATPASSSRRCRSRRSTSSGPLAGRQHRAEDDQQEPALDRRHRHRDPRLPAHPLRPARPAALPDLRPADRHADGRRDRREDPPPARGDEVYRDGPGRARPQGRVRRRSGTTAARASPGSGSTAQSVDARQTPPKLSHAASTGSRSSSTARSSAGRPRPRLADSVESALAWARGRAHRRGRTSADETDEPSWHVDRYKRQHRSCDGSRPRASTPHHFSFNSPLGWCPVCEGLGTQHGPTPAARPRPRRSACERRGRRLADRRNAGPSPDDRRRRRAEGIDLDTPFDDLPAAAREVLLHGTGEPSRVRLRARRRAASSAASRGRSSTRASSRASSGARGSVSATVREDLVRLTTSPCAACMGARLRDDSAAVFAVDFTIDGRSRSPSRPPRLGATRSPSSRA